MRSFSSVDLSDFCMPVTWFHQSYGGTRMMPFIEHACNRICFANSCIQNLQNFSRWKHCLLTYNGFRSSANVRHIGYISWSYIFHMETLNVSRSLEDSKLNPELGGPAGLLSSEVFDHEASCCLLKVCLESYLKILRTLDNIERRWKIRRHFLTWQIGKFSKSNHNLNFRKVQMASFSIEKRR